MITLKRTTSTNDDFKKLVILLDQDLKIRDGEDHDFYHQFNGIDALNNVVLAYINGEAAGCGAFKKQDEHSVEIKRMYVCEEYRKKGVAIAILNELEQWAAELNFIKTVLETGKKQPEAIALYQKVGYNLIPNYGQYENIENSVCMSKTIK